MDYDTHTSNEDSNSRKYSWEGKSLGSKDGRNKRDGEGSSSELQAPVAPPESPPETTKDGIVPLLLGPSCPLSNGSITAL